MSSSGCSPRWSGTTLRRRNSSGTARAISLHGRSATRFRTRIKLNAVARAAGRELQRYNRGLSLLDTAITVAPLLGLLGTVTGMIRSFSILGGQELGAPSAITGGIAEALIATAFGLGVAILALLPFNFLNAQLEQARHEVSDAASQLEACVTRTRRTDPA